MSQMAFASFIAFVAILLLRPLSATSESSGRGGDGDTLFIIPASGTINPTCSKAPTPPAPEMAPKENFTLMSLLNACHYIDCGGGLCHNKTSRFSYSCACNAGYYNLFNKTAFPCFKECALGMGCSELGISSPPAPSGLNEGSSILQGSSLWLVLLIMVMLFQ